MATRRQSERTVRARLLALAYDALASLPEGLTEPVTVSASDEAGSVTVQLQPAGANEDAAARLSPMERDIVQAIRLHGALGGKQLASRAGYRYDSTFKTIVANLVARDVLATGQTGYVLSVNSDPV